MAEDEANVQVLLTGATFPSPVMAPWPLANVEGVRKSIKPPNTKNGADGFLRG